MRAGVFGALAAVLTLAPASPAAAAAPSNDSLAGATVITSMPFTAQQDTTEATADAVDATATDSGWSTDASVWHTWTAPADGLLSVNTWGSDYDAAVAIGTLSSAGLTPLWGTTWYGSASGRVQGGVTYYVLAFDPHSGDERNGGGLSLGMTFQEIKPLVLSVQPDSGLIERNGDVTLTGSVACSGATELYISGTVTQVVGRTSQVQGSFYATVPCTTGPWSAVVVPQSGKFAGGRATVGFYAHTCGPWDCKQVNGRPVVQLKRAR